MIGVALRVAVGAAVPAAADGFGWPTLLVNLAGSFLLGALVGRVVRRRAGGPLVERFLGTGVLGSFTTYSALAVETNRLLVARPALGAAFAMVSLGGGLAAAGVGLAAGRR